MVGVIRFKRSQELFHYALGGKWVVGTLGVGKRSEVCGGMTKSRRDNDRMNLGVQHVVREFNEFVRYTQVGFVLAASAWPISGIGYGPGNPGLSCRGTHGCVGPLGQLK